MLSCVLLTLPQKKHWLQDNIFTLPIKITKTRTKSKLVVRYVQNFAKAPKKQHKNAFVVRQFIYNYILFDVFCAGCVCFFSEQAKHHHPHTPTHSTYTIRTLYLITFYLPTHYPPLLLPIHITTYSQPTSQHKKTHKLARLSAIYSHSSHNMLSTMLCCLGTKIKHTCLSLLIKKRNNTISCHCVLIICCYSCSCCYWICSCSCSIRSLPLILLITLFLLSLPC